MKTPSWLEEVIRAPEDEYTRLVAADTAGLDRDEHRLAGQARPELTLATDSVRKAMARTLSGV